MLKQDNSAVLTTSLATAQSTIRSAAFGSFVQPYIIQFDRRSIAREHEDDSCGDVSVISSECVFELPKHSAQFDVVSPESLITIWSLVDTNMEGARHIRSRLVAEGVFLVFHENYVVTHFHKPRPILVHGANGETCFQATGRGGKGYASVKLIELPIATSVLTEIAGIVFKCTAAFRSRLPIAGAYVFKFG